jgi:hypothetical protein
MSKKSAGFTGIGISLVVLLVVYFVFTHRAEESQNPYSLIPSDAIVFWESAKADELINSICHESEIWENLSQISEFRALDKELERIDSLAKYDPTVESVLSRSQIFLSIHETGKARFHWFILLELPIDVSAKKAIEKLQQTMVSQTSSQRKYEGTIIYDIDFGKNRFLSFTGRKGNILVSSSPVLIEDAIREAGSVNHFSDHELFKRVQRSKGKHVEANMYVNSAQIHRFIEALTKSNTNSTLGIISNSFAWTELDAKISSNSLVLNGFTNAADSLNQYLSYYNKYSAREIKSFTILPATSSTFISKNIQNYTSYYKFLEKYYASNALNTQFEQVQNDAVDELGFDVRAEIAEIFDDEFTIATVNPLEFQNKSKVAVIKTTGKTFAEEKMQSIVDQIVKTKNLSKRNIISTIKPEANTKYTVYKLPSKSIMKSLLGFSAQGIENPYILIHDNYLICASGKEMLTHIINSNIRNNTISNKPNFAQVTEYFPSKANILFYSNLLTELENLESVLEKEVFEFIQENKKDLGSFFTIGASFYSTNKMLNTNVYFGGTKPTENESNLQWKTKLDTISRFKPFLFKNHYTKNNDIFIQDESNTIYLINKSGRILWKLPLSEKITSDVFQVDYYENNKFQILFSTENYLHCFDRLGNYVDKYPVRLRSGTEQGMSLIQYTDSDDYRIFVPEPIKNICLHPKRTNCERLGL